MSKNLNICIKGDVKKQQNDSLNVYNQLITNYIFISLLYT